MQMTHFTSCENVNLDPYLMMAFIILFWIPDNSKFFTIYENRLESRVIPNGSPASDFCEIPYYCLV